MMRTRLSLVTALLVTSLAATGCTAQVSTAEPVTLSMYHVDGEADLEPAVDWFAERVKELSAGAITIEIERGCCGERVEVEEDLVAAVAGGEADLGWVGTRVFGDLGVAELAPLTAPLLLDSYRLQEAVIADDAATQALAAVDEVGVEGIALVPGALRRPLSNTKPLMTPADWEGLTVASFHSAQNADSFRALGAEPRAVTFAERNVGLFDGSIQVLENSLGMLDSEREQILPYTTVNLALWPRISAIIGSEQTVTQLGPDGLAVLRRAAGDVAQMSDELIKLDADALASACSDGARFAEASADQLAEFRSVFAPIYERLQDGAATSELYSAITALKESVESEPALSVPIECTGEAPVEPDANSDGNEGALNGRYQGVKHTIESLRANGFTPEDADGVAGTFTLVFEDGAFELIHDWHGGERFGCTGEYSIDGDRVTVDYDPGGDCGPGGELFNSGFTVTGDQAVFTDFESAYETDLHIFTSAPFTRLD